MFMEKNQEKTQAELYREERKKRMAKVAQKNSKKSPQLSKIGRGFGKCLGIVVIVAVCLVAIYGILSFFGIPQRALTAMKVGDKKVSVAKYNYYYMSVYTQTLYQAVQYESQGQGYGQMYTGFDYSKMPEEQAYTAGTIDGIENPTWEDYFDDQARKSIQQFDLYAEQARLSNITLTDEEKKDIEDNIQSLRDGAKNNDYSLSRFIVINYGKGVTESIIREALENQKLAQSYFTAKKEEFTKAVTGEKVNEEFAANIQNYTTVGVAYFTVTAETPELAEDATDEQKTAANQQAMADAKAKAEAYLAQVTDDASVVRLGMEYNAQLNSDSIVNKEASGSSLSSIGESAVDWIYAADRAVGDKTVIEGTNGYTVLYLISLPQKDTTKLANVRHILFQFETTDEQSEPTDEQKAAAKAQAEEVYKKYQANPTEDNFAALAKENSADPGSKDKGGLYENVYPGQMVESFNDWVFDEARKPGDTDIVETNYGYHIIYYIGNDNTPEYWYYQCQQAVANKDFENYNTNLLNTKPITPNASLINWAKSSLDSIVSNIIYRFSQQLSSYR